MKQSDFMQRGTENAFAFLMPSSGVLARNSQQYSKAFSNRRQQHARCAVT